MGETRELAADVLQRIAAAEHADPATDDLTVPLAIELAQKSDAVGNLQSLLYDAIVELSYVQSVENCNSGLCATPMGKEIIERGMKLLGVADLSGETWKTATRKGA